MSQPSLGGPPPTTTTFVFSARSIQTPSANEPLPERATNRNGPWQTISHTGTSTRGRFTIVAAGRKSLLPRQRRWHPANNFIHQWPASATIMTPASATTLATLLSQFRPTRHRLAVFVRAPLASLQLPYRMESMRHGTSVFRSGPLHEHMAPHATTRRHAAAGTIATASRRSPWCELPIFVQTGQRMATLRLPHNRTAQPRSAVDCGTPFTEAPQLPWGTPWISWC